MMEANRRERRARAAMERSSKFVREYVRHLPEAGPEVMSKPGISHMVFYHDDWCRMYTHGTCNCNPYLRFFAEPKRD